MKKKKHPREYLKKEGEELQDYLNFRKRGSKVESKKRYNRQKMKKEWQKWQKKKNESSAGWQW